LEREGEKEGRGERGEKKPKEKKKGERLEGCEISVCLNLP
jgi:hypothetical protein